MQARPPRRGQLAEQRLAHERVHEAVPRPAESGTSWIEPGRDTLVHGVEHLVGVVVLGSAISLDGGEVELGADDRGDEQRVVRGVGQA